MDIHLSPLRWRGVKTPYRKTTMIVPSSLDNCVCPMNERTRKSPKAFASTSLLLESFVPDLPCIMKTSNNNSFTHSSKPYSWTTQHVYADKQLNSIYMEISFLSLTHSFLSLLHSWIQKWKLSQFKFMQFMHHWPS